MKFNYDLIRHNLKTYEIAKQQLPIIELYEKGQVNLNSMRSIGLEEFANFFNFITALENQGFKPIEKISWRKLKQLLVENTSVGRFKTYLNNRTQAQFTKFFTEDIKTLDRLLNGRWLTKPGYIGRRGRRHWGRRSEEVLTGLDKCFIPIINWLIINEIDVSEDFNTELYQKFDKQSKWIDRIKWYHTTKLSLDGIPDKEIEVTHTMLKSFTSLIEDAKIDFRKLNSDFIIDMLSNKIKSLMKIEQGTLIRSKVDLITARGNQRLTIGKDYRVESCTIQSGFIRVMIVDDSGIRNWYEYTNFEDKSIDRDLLLNQLGIF